MYLYDPLQQAAQQHQQWGALGSAIFNPAMSQAYGQPFGQVGQPNLNAFGATSWGMPPTWQPIAQQYWQPQPWQQQSWQQRQLTQQDVGDVVRQLVPLLPQILAQAQPAAMGYGYGTQRSLTQQDVNEVVRQILPIVPQVAAVLQGHAPAAAIQAGYGAVGLQNPFAQSLFNQNPWAQPTFPSQNPFAQGPQLLQQHPFSQPGWPQFQSAFGGVPNWNQQQRTLTQNDVNDVVRQLVAIIPQAIANLQTLNQQRVI
jgi:hypothetical protein